MFRLNRLLFALSTLSVRPFPVVSSRSAPTTLACAPASPSSLASSSPATPSNAARSTSISGSSASAAASTRSMPASSKIIRDSVVRMSRARMVPSPEDADKKL